MTLLIPPLSPAGILRYEWVDPGGTVRDLTWETSPQRFVSKGSLGLGMPELEIAADKLPFAGGSIVRHIGTQPARIELPITISEDSFPELIDVLDDLRGWFDTGDERALSPGFLRVTRPDDSVRQLACYYAGGLEGDLTRGGPNNVTVVISLMAPDPWPTELADTVLTWTAAEAAAGVSVMNQGQLDAYPIWHITGPTATNTTTITNTTTGKALTMNAATATGLGIVIDTRPASLRDNLIAYRDLDSLNVFSSLGATSKLWWLAPGQNDITIALAGTDGTTRVELAYLARYRGLLR